METEQIKEFQKAVGGAAWKLDLWKFADAIGSDANHDYTKDKFREFQSLSKALNRFDSDTLAKVLAAGANQ